MRAPGDLRSSSLPPRRPAWIAPLDPMRVISSCSPVRTFPQESRRVSPRTCKPGRHYAEPSILQLHDPADKPAVPRRRSHDLGRLHDLLLAHFDAIRCAGMAFTKILPFVGFLFPLLGIRWVLRGRGA